MKTKINILNKNSLTDENLKDIKEYLDDRFKDSIETENATIVTYNIFISPKEFELSNAWGMFCYDEHLYSIDTIETDADFDVEVDADELPEFDRL